MTVATNDGRVHVAEPAHVNSSPTGGLTASVAEAWAAACDFITVNPGKEQGQGATIAAQTSLGIYTKAMHDPDAALPEAEYSHHWTGSELRRKANLGYAKPIYIMQPSSAWRAKHQADLVALKKRYPWCSVFFKDTARAAYDIGGAPVTPGSRATMTRTEWQQRSNADFQAWDAAVGYEHRMINGLAPDTMQTFTPSIGMVEAAFGPLDHTLPSYEAWQQLGNLAWDAQLRGWTPWLYAKMAASHGSAEWDRFRSLSLASAMLWDRGSLLYCIGGREGTPPGWATGEYTHPWYRPGFGAPRSAPPASWHDYLRPSGVYAKRYQTGVVLVNPTMRGLAHTMGDGSTHTVAAQSGVLMRRESDTWVNI